MLVNLMLLLFAAMVHAEFCMPLARILDARMRLAIIKYLYPINILLIYFTEIAQLPQSALASKVALNLFNDRLLMARNVIEQMEKDGIYAIFNENALIKLVLEQPNAYTDSNILNMLDNPQPKHFGELDNMLPAFFLPNITKKHWQKVQNSIYNYIKTSKKFYLDDSLARKIFPECGWAYAQLPLFLHHYIRFLSFAEYQDEESSNLLDSQGIFDIEMLHDYFSYLFVLLVHSMRPLDGLFAATRQALLAVECCTLTMLLGSSEIHNNSEEYFEKLGIFFTLIVPEKKLLADKFMNYLD